MILLCAGKPLPRPGLDVVEPHVLDPGTVGPRLLAGDRTGMAPDALVEVHHHGDLRHDPADRPFPRSGSFLPFRHQLRTSVVRLRTIVTSAPWLPVGPR